MMTTDTQPALTITADQLAALIDAYLTMMRREGLRSPLYTGRE